MIKTDETYEKEMDFKELLFRILFSWRIIIITSLVLAILLGGYRYKSLHSLYNSAALKTQEESYNKALATYETNKNSILSEINNLQNSINQQKDYNENSLLMQIDPMNKQVYCLNYYIDTNYKINPELSYQNVDKADSIISAYFNYSSNGDLNNYVVENLSSDIKPKYLQEILMVTPDYDRHMLSIQVTHKDERISKEIIILVKEYFEKAYDRINELIGKHELKIFDEAMISDIDFVLKETQRVNLQLVTDYENRVIERNNALNILVQPTMSTTSKSVIIKSAIKYAFLGIAIGIILISFILLFSYLLSDKMFNATEIRKRYNLRILGTIKKVEKRLFGFVDQWLSYFEGSNTFKTNEDEELKYISANIKSIVKVEDKQTYNIMLTGTTKFEKIEEICKKLNKTLNNNSINLVCGANICYNAETIEQICECNAVVIIEEIKKSTYNNISNELTNIKDLGKNIIGIVLI